MIATTARIPASPRKHTQARHARFADCDPSIEAEAQRLADAHSQLRLFDTHPQLQLDAQPAAGMPEVDRSAVAVSGAGAGSCVAIAR